MASSSTDIRPQTLVAAGAVVALTATVASLYLSLGLGLTPCRLCWYQRIMMYPLVIILGVATITGRVPVLTVLPLSVSGIGIAAYHSWLQLSTMTCRVGSVSCGTVQYRIGGLTIPNLALLAFIIVTATVGLAQYMGYHGSDP